MENNPAINAHIIELPGDGDDSELLAYYQVNLAFLPRIGDLIDLYSFIDVASSHPPRHFYEVVQVVHVMHDINKHNAEAKQENHFIKIFVKHSESDFLASQ